MCHNKGLQAYARKRIAHSNTNTMTRRTRHPPSTTRASFCKERRPLLFTNVISPLTLRPPLKS